MNDSQEFVRGKEVLQFAISQLPDDGVRRRMGLALKDSNGLDVYCACFSSVDDDLSQWRGYGENGAGVCLEFDLSGLLNSINGVGYWVIYGRPTDQVIQTTVATGLVQYIHDAITNLLPDPTPDAVFNEIREQLVEIWPALALAFKHSAFTAEAEFRIVYSAAIGDPAPVCFRPAPVVPFVKLKIRGGVQLPIKSIRLGPAVSTELNCLSLRLALDRLGLSQE
ncbi:MAG TPA: DUF2971 domain-containing protein [Chthonomonadaceae bacterium]|nr:DUF2971 domain-containing protein [Chthonomonadaceae bacterium]